MKTNLKKRMKESFLIIILRKYNFKSIMTELFETAKNFFKDNILYKSANILYVIYYICFWILYLNGIWNFILIELLIFISFLVLVINLKNNYEILKLLLGQVYITFMLIYSYFLFWHKDITNYSFNNYMFLVVVSFIIGMLILSIVLYYSTSKILFRRLHFICCLLNTVIFLIYILIYMGYGFIYYDLLENNITINDVKFNVKEHINKQNMHSIFISYALDNLTDKIGVTVGNSSIYKSISTEKIYFILMCKGFISTYIALVFAFISNSLFSRGGKDKN